MADDRMALIEALRKADDGNFLPSLAETVLQIQNVRNAICLPGRPTTIRCWRRLQRKPPPKTAAQDFSVFASRALAALRRAAILPSAYLIGNSSMASGS